MCGDVFYTVCRPSSVREFHYRSSVNACVETAADVVHSCNRGVNRFASLAHCRRSCTHAGRRPAKECLGKPLLTSCARYLTREPILVLSALCIRIFKKELAIHFIIFTEGRTV